MSKNPVQTVSSIGKVNSAEKSIPTGIIGTRQIAATTILAEIKLTFFV